MFNFKKKEDSKTPKLEIPLETLNDKRHELADLRFQSLVKKVAEQDIIIRRLLDLVIANIEHREYSRFLLPKITAIKNLLDSK